MIKRPQIEISLEAPKIIGPALSVSSPQLQKKKRKKKLHWDLSQLKTNML